MVYNSGFEDNDWSCEDNVWARKSGLYTIHRLSFAKNLFQIILSTYGKIVENRNFLKYFKKVYNPGFWDNDWSCEDKLWARKSGLYTIHKASFSKNLFQIILSTYTVKSEV